MARQQTKTTHKPVEPTAWQEGIKALVFLGLSLALLLSAWIFTARSVISGPDLGSLLILGALSALLALTLERGLFYLRMGKIRRYRSAFLAAASLPVVGWLAWWALQSVVSPSSLGPPGISAIGLTLALVFAPMGAFLGCLLATSVREGLWENNSPPSALVQSEVHQLHQQVIGEPGRAPWTKRWFDRALALLGLVLSAPVWGLSAFLVWFEDPGPVLFVKNSVGRGGVNFHQFKLRTMVCGAENNTGPILAQQGDHRVLRFGNLLRKTALDELPQLINILRAEMSFVGPRPQRTVLVRDYLAVMPEYADRHRVLPGLAGLAQVAGDYYLTPRQKLRFDRLYINYMSLGFDLKLLALAFLITFWYRWQADWNGRLPRRLLRFGARG